MSLQLKMEYIGEYKSNSDYNYDGDNLIGDFAPAVVEKSNRIYFAISCKKINFSWIHSFIKTEPFSELFFFFNHFTLESYIEYLAESIYNMNYHFWVKKFEGRRDERIIIALKSFESQFKFIQRNFFKFEKILNYFCKPELIQELNELNLIDNFGSIYNMYKIDYFEIVEIENYIDEEVNDMCIANRDLNCSKKYNKYHESCFDFKCRNQCLCIDQREL